MSEVTDEPLEVPNAPQSLLNFTLLKKNFRESLVMLICCGLALFVISWVKTFADSKISTTDLQNMIGAIPDYFTDMIPGNMSFMMSYTGRMALTFEHPIVFLCLAVFCVARSSDVVSGQLGRGTMEILLAQPITRLQVLVNHSVVTLFGVFVLCFLAWFGLYIGYSTLDVTERVSSSIGIPDSPFQISLPFTTKEIHEPMIDYIDQWSLLAAPANFFGVGVMFCGVTTLFSAMDRYRWRTIGIITGFYVVQIFVVLIGEANVSFYWIEFFSIFTAYKPTVFAGIAAEEPELFWHWIRFTKEGDPKLGFLPSMLILLGSSLICYIAAAYIFVRRDLPAPV